MKEMSQKVPVYVDMKSLKQFAAEKLLSSPLKEILLLEDDKLDVYSFLIKLPTWLQLARWIKERREKP